MQRSCPVREHVRGRLYSYCRPVKVEIGFVAPQSGGKLQTHLSLCAKMRRSVNRFLHDKLTESNVFPRPHPFTPAPPGKITKQGGKREKRGLRASDLKTGEGKTICEKNLPWNPARLFQLIWTQYTFSSQWQMKCQVLANIQTRRIPLIIPACDHGTFLQAQKDVVCYPLPLNCLIYGHLKKH